MELFGTAHAPWKPELWHAVDDRVRGGASTSALDLVSSSEPAQARFHGHLDITTLGGAGFASQVYTRPPSLPASQYKGVSFQSHLASDAVKDLEKAALREGPKEFVLTLKTQPPERRPDGRLESRLSFEYHFTPQSDNDIHVALWKDFVPTYRGRRVSGHLDPSKLTEIGIMCRSGFGAQQGDFDLQLGQVVALREDRGWLSLDWWKDWIVSCLQYWLPQAIRI